MSRGRLLPILPLQPTKETYFIQILTISITFSVFGLTLQSLHYLGSNFDQISVSHIKKPSGR